MYSLTARARGDFVGEKRDNSSTQDWKLGGWICVPRPMTADQKLWVDTTSVNGGCSEGFLHSNGGRTDANDRRHKASAQAVIEFKNLSFRYGKATILPSVFVDLAGN